MDKETEQKELKERLFALLKLPDNAICCDCGDKSPEWASWTLGVFLCVDCSGMHRKLSSDFSRVKSVRLDNWKPAEVEEMVTKGNAASNLLFLARLAPFRSVYVFPKSTDGPIVREQWIRSKYERKEWMAGDGVSLSNQLRVMEYTVPLLEDWIVKRGAKRHSWKRRWMVMIGSTCAYYGKKTDVAPKGTFSLRDVSDLVVAREPMEKHNNVLVVTQQGAERQYFVSMDSGQQVFDWLQMMRMARLRLVDGKMGKQKAATRTVAELASRAHNELVLKQRKFGRGTFDNTFLGSQLIDWLMVVEALVSRDDAAAVANEMLNAKKIAHCSMDVRTVVDGFEPYTFQGGR